MLIFSNESHVERWTGFGLQLNHPQSLDADVENGIVSGFHPRDSGSALIESKIVTKAAYSYDDR